MSDDKPYSIGRHRGKFCVVWYDEGKRYRKTLDSTTKSSAEREAPGVFEDLRRPTGSSVGQIWKAYVREKAGRAVVSTMTHTWKALEGRFDRADPSLISVSDCRAHVAERRAVRTKQCPNGIHDGTIHTELGHLRMVLLWAEKNGIIAKAPFIERPPKPAPSERHLSKPEVAKLLAAAKAPHLKLFIMLGIATGGRSSALLDLTWDRVDFLREKIDLRNPGISTPHKGRAIVPMNRMIKEALLEAHRAALSSHVIEWGGQRVGSVKKSLGRVARLAGVGNVSPHVLRHSSAVHMAEAGIPMEEIAQFLGHRNVKVTRDVYARFSPNHLREAAAVLDYGSFPLFGERDAN